MQSVLAALAASALLIGCLDLEDATSDRQGTFPLHDGVLMQVLVEEGDNTNWTWSSTQPLTFAVWQTWFDEGVGRDQKIFLLGANGTGHAGHHEATRQGHLMFEWTMLPTAANATVDVTYFIRTDGHHTTIHF